MTNPIDNLSPFNWQGQPSQIINALGRIKTERQILLDGNRVNPYSDLGRNPGQTKSSTAPR